ncbi:MAG: FAD-dependent oxidoreductase [Oscillospiraceae bacterium]|nr:FAD-dependent oxidoreductase [Oscillospiraceae bacterium]
MKLLTPIKINGLTLKNRMAVSAMVTNYCEEDGLPNEKWICYHEQKAKGGWGLIITEDYRISPEAGGFKNLPGLWSDAQIPAHRAFTDRMHNAGAVVAAQIYHAGRETCGAVTGVRCVAPSAVKDPTMSEIPRELSVEEIEELVEQFATCALRVKQAGFDAVEIHGAHGYLINQFVSPFSNKRSDEYGGDLLGRSRFATEIVKRVRELCGRDYPIIYRMSAQEYVHGGLSLAESCALARLLEGAGADCINCSQGVYTTAYTITPPSGFPLAGYIENASAIKSSVGIPVMAAGRINDPLIAEMLLQGDKTDICVMARSSLADPEMPNKVCAGRFGDILHCIGCLQGCIGENNRGGTVRCLVNPLTGMEYKYDLSSAKAPKKIAVVGGGVAGCEAAIVASSRGHKVTLFEKSNELGGQWRAACVPPGKSEFASFLLWQRRQLTQYGVEVKMNCEVDAELLNKDGFDTVIDACGSVPLCPSIPGLKENFISANEILLGRELQGTHFTVIGGGLVGCETADHLASQGCKVVVLEMKDAIASDGEPSCVHYLLERLRENGVEIITGATVTGVSTHAVEYQRNDVCHSLDRMDAVVCAVGSKANSLCTNDVILPVIRVGDAKQARNGYIAIREGYEAGLNV